MANAADHVASHLNESSALIEEMMSLLANLAVRFDAEDDEERQWMVRQCQNPLAAELVPELTVTMLHVLDAIGRLEPVNGITISKQFDIPKGSVSKITRRLIAKNLVEKEFLPNNKKEVLFRMTPLGREIFTVHRALHQQMNRGFIQFLQRYPVEDLRLVMQMLEDLKKLPRVGVEFRPDLLDADRN